VIFVPGKGFNVNNPGESTLRLSFAAPTLKEVEEGVQRLADALRALHKVAA
jgi:DNA-binding transcriptional MocR family regulator